MDEYWTTQASVSYLFLFPFVSFLLISNSLVYIFSTRFLVCCFLFLLHRTAKAVSYADDSSDDADDEGGGGRRRSRVSGKATAAATAADDSASEASGDEGDGGSDSDSLDLNTTTDDDEDDDSLNLDSSSDAGGSESRRRRRRGRGSNEAGKASRNRKSGGGRKKKAGGGGADGLTWVRLLLSVCFNLCHFSHIILSHHIIPPFFVFFLLLQQQRQQAKVEAGLNPQGLTRNVEQGPQEGESVYDHRKNMLLKHQEVVGNMTPKFLYRIPFDERFPPHMWGENLGTVVSEIRKGNCHADKREELETLGFDFGKQAMGTSVKLGWEVVEACIVQYKAANPETTKEKGWKMPRDFEVPDGDAAWPEKAWGKPLGETMHNIRRGLCYREHRAEIEALDIVVNY